MSLIVKLALLYLMAGAVLGIGAVVGTQHVQAFPRGSVYRISR
jgi:hypothetical protein